MVQLNKIYNEDCLEGMKRISDGSIDAVICDLPYGTTKNSWDSLIPLEPLWSEYRRIIKQRGAIVLFAQQPFASKLISSNYEMFKYEWIWQKEQGTGFLNSKFAPLKVHENILVFSRSAACFVKKASDAMIYNPQFRQGKAYSHIAISTSTNYDSKWYKPFETSNDGSHYYPTDMLRFERDKDKMHPTQKPVDLVRYLVRTYTSEGDTVLDNCMGSGTTAIACIREKRNFIGFELNNEYWSKSEKRIEKELSQLHIDF